MSSVDKIQQYIPTYTPPSSAQEQAVQDYIDGILNSSQIKNLLKIDKTVDGYNNYEFELFDSSTLTLRQTPAELMFIHKEKGADELNDLIEAGNTRESFDRDAPDNPCLIKHYTKKQSAYIKEDICPKS